MTATSRFSKYKFTNADVVEKIPYSIVTNTEKLKLVPNLEYAEMKLPYNDIDILIRVEFYEKIIENERKMVNGLIIHNTKFDHVISGIYNSPVMSETKFTGVSIIEIDKQLEKFWLTEEIDIKKEENSDAVVAKEIFVKTFSRNKDGQFVVNLLTKRSINS